MLTLPTFVRVLIASLLIGGYGAMYTGSIVHDLGHMIEHSAQGGAQDCEGALAEQHNESHLEVSCFFCAHGSVIASYHTAVETWTPASYTVDPPTGPASHLAWQAPLQFSLRGPPAA